MTKMVIDFQKVPREDRAEVWMEVRKRRQKRRLLSPAIGRLIQCSKKIDRWRRRDRFHQKIKRATDFTPEMSAPTPEDSLLIKEQWCLVEQALQHLSSNYRKTLLFFFEYKDYQECAHLMNVSRSTFQRSVRRASERLSVILKRLEKQIEHNHLN